METPNITQNAHKAVFLVQQYPDHKLTEVIALLQLPAIDINNAIWCAIEQGYLAEPNAEDGTIELLRTPDAWDFGTKVAGLKGALLYAFQQLEKKETDLEENYLSNWTQGYAAQDVLIATKQLIADELLATYTLRDGDSDYTFFTLYANRDKQWGKSQFKKEPVADEPSELENNNLLDEIASVGESEVESEPVADTVQDGDAVGEAKSIEVKNKKG